MTHRRPGFTLIEVLIYTVFVGMIMIAMTLLANTTFTVRSKLRASLILEQNVRVAVSRIVSLVNAASDISVPSLGGSGGTLVLTMPVTTQNPTTITSIDGTIIITQGAAGTAQTLTSNEIVISTLLFARVSSTTPMVRMVVLGGTRNASASYGVITTTTTAAVRR